jgi:hypothetical protein
LSLLRSLSTPMRKSVGRLARYDAGGDLHAFPAPEMRSCMALDPTRVGEVYKQLAQAEVDAFGDNTDHTDTGKKKKKKDPVDEEDAEEAQWEDVDDTGLALSDLASAEKNIFVPKVKTLKQVQMELAASQVCAQVCRSVPELIDNPEVEDVHVLCTHVEHHNLHVRLCCAFAGWCHDASSLRWATFDLFLNLDLFSRCYTGLA